MYLIKKSDSLGVQVVREFASQNEAVDHIESLFDKRQNQGYSVDVVSINKIKVFSGSLFEPVYYWIEATNIGSNVNQTVIEKRNALYNEACRFLWNSGGGYIHGMTWNAKKQELHQFETKHGLPITNIFRKRTQKGA